MADVWMVELHSPDAQSDELWHRMRRHASTTRCGITVCINVDVFEMPDAGAELCEVCSSGD